MVMGSSSRSNLKLSCRGVSSPPGNLRRFNTYFEYHRKVSRLLFKAIEVWALTCSMKMDDDWVPIVLVQLATGLPWSDQRRSEHRERLVASGAAPRSPGPG
jgi:hypothetical protein